MRSLLEYRTSEIVAVRSQIGRFLAAAALGFAVFFAAT